MTLRQEQPVIAGKAARKSNPGLTEPERQNRPPRGRSETFSAARRSPLSRLDARSGCRLITSKNHSIHQVGIIRFTQEVYEAIQGKKTPSENGHLKKPVVLSAFKKRASVTKACEFAHMYWNQTAAETRKKTWSQSWPSDL